MKEAIPDYKKIYEQRIRDLERLKNEIEYFLDEPKNENIDILHNTIDDYHDQWIKVKK